MGARRRLAFVLCGFPLVSGPSPGPAQDGDCNANGIPDASEVAASELDFSASDHYYFDGSATALAVADLDGDSLPDVVLAGRLSKSIGILSGTPAGALAGEVSISLAAEPRAVESIDIDHDGDQDVVVVLQPTSRLALLANDGDGNLASAADMATGAGPHSIAAADFDGDGWTDVAVGASNVFGIHLGRQSGFGDAVIHQRPGAIGVAAGLIDADPLPDLAVGLSGTEGAAVYLSNGVLLEAAGTAGTPEWPRYLAVADFDGDGFADLAAGSSLAPEASVSWGRGDGTFDEPRLLDLPADRVPLSAADLDRDGTPELALVSGGFLRVLSARGGAWDLGPPFIASRALALEMSDLDADGLLDALLLSENQLLVHRGLAGRRFLTDSVVLVPDAVGVAAADFDGDGEVDLVAGSDEAFGQVFFHRGLGGGSFGSSVVGPSSHGPFVLEPVDFSGDGAMDLLVLGWAGHLGALENLGGGIFRLVSDVYSPGIRGDALAVIDIDGDGEPDMIVLDRDAGAVGVYPVSAAGTIGPPVLGATLDEPALLRAGDITGDGLAEIVVASRTRVVAHPGRGRTGLGPSIPIAERDLLSGLELADVDGDGFLDLVLALRDFDLEVLRGQTGGAFASGIATLGPGPRKLRAFDANGDGRLDLAAAHGEEVSLSIGSGEGEFGHPHPLFVGMPVDSFAIADIDRDGSPDAAALWSNDQASGITVLLNETEPPASPDCDGNGVPDACDIRDGSTTDVDSNGIPDVCDPDCDGDGTLDALEIRSGGAADVDADGVPDPCERDCNANGVPDDHEIASGLAADVDRNLVPDACQPDCNANEVPDVFEIDSGQRLDLNGNARPDDCDPDCNRNTVPDDEDLRRHDSRDANRNELPDECDIESGTSEDRNGNGVPDETEVDCDGSGVPDMIEILDGVAADRNRNRRIDDCDIRDGLSADVDLDGVPDEAQPDCDGDGVPDGHAIATGAATDCDADGLPDGCDVSSGSPHLGFPRTLPAFSLANAVVVADLDADGLEDIIVLDQDSQRQYEPVLSVHLHGGTAGFRSLPAVDLPAHYSSPVSGDFDRDGRMDLAVVLSNPNTVALVPGNGDGTFGSPISLGVGMNPRGLLPVDLTCDGKLDLITRNARDLILVEGRGNGTFEAPRPVGGVRFLPNVSAGDMDRDGKMDLVFSQDSLVVLPGDCAGSFRERVESDAPADLSPPVIEDLDRDGIPDVAAIGESGFIPFRGVGDGTFESLDPLPMDPKAGSLAIIDLDGDGRPDIVTISDLPGHVSISRGLGGFAFSPRREFFAGIDARGAAFLDADLDGDRDIVTASREGIVMLAQEDGALEAPIYLPLPGATETSLHDLNKDGLLDLLVTRPEEHAIDVLPGDDDVGFGAPTRVTVPAMPASVTASDLDRDGFEDLAYVESDSKVIEILRGGAAGEFEHAGTIQPSDSSMAVGIRFADFTEDGFPDLLRMGLTPMLLFPGKGDGTFEAPKPVRDFLGDSDVPIADMDRDGHLDIVYAPQSQATPTVLFGDGTGGFPRARAFQIGRQAPTDVIATDLDGDAVLDLALTFLDPGAVSVVRGNGRGFFLAPKLFSVGPDEPISLVAVDLDRDGVSDLVTFDRDPVRGPGSPGGLSILRGDGNLGFQTPVRVPGTAGWGLLYAVDLPGTEGMDIVLRIAAFSPTSSNFPTHGVLLYRNTTQPADDPDCDRNGLPDSCDLAAGPSVDCDGNGVLDRCQELPLEGPCLQAGCRVPGDCNEDGRMDMTDGLCVLGYIFLGNPAALPCGLGSHAESSNLDLLDWQPDGFMDISDAIALFSYLHLGAPPHILAVPGSETTACVPVEGCSDP